MASIKSKIAGGYLISIIITIVFVEIIAIVAIRSYYYRSLEERLTNQISISSNFYNTYFYNSTLRSNVANDVDLFWEDTDVKAQIIDKNGNIIMDSQGEIFDKIERNDNFKNLISGKNRMYKEKTDINGVSVISVYMPLYYNSEIDGVLRFISSTENIKTSIIKLSKYAVMSGIGVVILSSFVSVLISNSVSRPLKNISDGAEKMAKGNFKEKIPKFADDELGKLSDTLNYMSEEILKNEKVKNEFIASVSHELRTPLTSIKGWSIVLKSSDFEDEEEIKEGLDIIEQEVDRLTYLVEDLLDFSKLLSGNITLKKQNTDMEELVESVCRQVNPRIRNEGLGLSLKIDGQIPIVMVDKNRIKQVLINIIDNAIKFTDKGGNIGVHLRADENNIYMSVKDNGSGISKEDLLKVKEKFYKGNSSKSSNGIGLSVCEEIMELHNGKLKIESEINIGTEVTLSVPIKLLS
ncbi:sensor histidine kinase [Clostridium ihumii]|uniref:sensor histidine kinase n=1 Tax=Clostridium ihumii TaxID=1470356 RepID=UPI00058FE527|nr:HAMP domain-containing sensor histidine kinase [Clostridium ihumii]